MYKDFPKIVSATALENYKLFLTFDDGISGEIALGQYKGKGKGVFEYWNDENNFKNFQIINNALTWNEDLDMCGDSFYLQIINKTFFEYAGN